MNSKNNLPTFPCLRGKISNSNFGISTIEFENYCKFIYVVKKNPNLNVVPTKQIDKVWHLHMSDSNLYKKDCLSYVGYIVKHKKDSKTISNQHIENYLYTNQLWQQYFNSKLGDLTNIAVREVDGGDNTIDR